MKHYRFDSRGVLFVDGKVATTLSDDEHGLMLAALSMRADVHSIGRNEGAAEYRETLRDKIAMAALASIAFDGLPDGGGCTIESYDAEGVARQVYKIADAMLAERAKKGGA